MRVKENWDLLSRKSMSKKARERKRLIRILKSEGLPSDPKSVKEWQRKIQSLYWQSDLEHRVISRFQRSKRSVGIVGGFARYMYPGLWEPAPNHFLGSMLLSGML